MGNLGGNRGTLLVMGATLLMSGLGLETTTWAQSSTRKSAPTSEIVPAQASTSTTEVETRVPGLKDKLVLNYWGAYNGPALQGASAYTPSSQSGRGDAQNLDGYVTLGYKPADTLMTGVAIPFLYEPTAAGRGIVMKDLFLRVARSKVIDRQRLHLDLSGRLYLPTTAESRAIGYLAGIRAEQNLTYDLPNSALKLGSYSYVKVNQYQGQGSGGTPLTFYVAPYANYKLSPSVTATLWTDVVQLKQARGNRFLDMKNDPIDVQPGVNWDVSENVSVNPYINLFPENLSLKTASLAMIVTAKAL